MASQVTTPRRIPGAPPNIFMEGEGFSYETPQPILKPNVESSSSSSQSKIQPRESTSSPSGIFASPAVSTSPYGGEMPAFGRPFGFRERGESSKSAEKAASIAPKRKLRAPSLNPYADLLAEADNDLDRYVESPSGFASGSRSGYDAPSHYLQRPGLRRFQFEEEPEMEDKPPEGAFTTSDNPPKECVVCLEPFLTRTKPPKWISLACMHEPAVCTPCLTQSIKSDLENKMWDKIQCPECGTLLIYEDVKRLADAITFSKYEILSFRSALSSDPNFIWCQKCSFGQLHTSASPTVRCLNCNHRTCFNHQGTLHTDMTCSEYDSFLEDPDNFVPASEREAGKAGESSDPTTQTSAAPKEKQKEEVEEKEPSRETTHRDRLAEQERQRQKHLEVRKLAKEAQAAEAKKKRAEWEREELKRKIKEEKLSLEKVGETTKRCPGCQWPIEKRSGCAHMTCIKCTHEFCWECLAEYSAIREGGNDYHKEECRFHSDNLPNVDDDGDGSEEEEESDEE